MSHVAPAIALLAFATMMGSLVWFFFAQTPLLLRRLGRDRFVPLQLALVSPLFKVALALSVVGAAASWGSGASAHVVGLALAAVLLSTALVAVVVPRAVRAGGASLREVVAPDDQTALGRFTADGGGDATKVWHRVLGLMTVALVAVGAAHLVLSLPHQTLEGAAHAHHADGPTTAPRGQRWEANRETVEGVRTMQALVTKAQADRLTTLEAASELRMAWSGIFERCTMTGPAHEALHGFLVPLGGLLGELENASDRDGARAVLQRVSAQLSTFDRDFVQASEQPALRGTPR
ncbi:MAG: hypothetical protein JNJ54_29030 [Myxococcaceae bacterium]|nr:hypothetical protein [Myxococcaceae bacterium]